MQGFIVMVQVLNKYFSDERLESTEGADKPFSPPLEHPLLSPYFDHCILCSLITL